MNLSRKNLTIAFLAVVAILAALALAGHPLIDPAALAGIGMLPLAMSGEVEMKDVIEMLKKQGDAMEGHIERVRLMEEDHKALMKKAGRPFPGNPGGNNDGPRRIKTASGKELLLFAKGQMVSNAYKPDASDEFSLGQYCRDAVLGSTKASSGPALVPLNIGSQIIDGVRARTVLVEAGAGTIMIEGPTNLARLTQDPTVHQHTEGADDITETDIAASPVVLNPKLLAALIPLTAELVEDSPNLDALLNTALANAFAAKIDALGLAKILADSAIPDSAAGQDPAVWLKVLEAVGSALALNQALPSAHISSPSDFIARASQLASTGGTWLGKPPALASMLELQTTGLTAGTALLGNFEEAFALAVRSDLRVEVVRHAKPGSASHLLVAHARADGVVLQPGKLFKQLKTVA